MPQWGNNILKKIASMTKDELIDFIIKFREEFQKERKYAESEIIELNKKISELKDRNKFMSIEGKCHFCNKNFIKTPDKKWYCNMKCYEQDLEVKRICRAILKKPITKI